jgi:hypothetical protein
MRKVLAKAVRAPIEYIWVHPIPFLSESMGTGQQSGRHYHDENYGLTVSHHRHSLAVYGRCNFS